MYPTSVDPIIAVLHSQDLRSFVSVMSERLIFYDGWLTEMTADAVNPVLTLRLAVMNLIDELQNVLLGKSSNEHFRFAVIFPNRLFQDARGQHHDCMI